ncbi:MAG: hypothetical protein ACD_69C00229G0005 [uncultured bacterium]|nr:MAG: hypothetical protein ACD_69C00229G0005 [uncultured bacterium]OGT09730.1 MAG: hypothetical protein A2V89_03945 [Gammaproteobacteria bacterium RBG_16_37_9]HBY55488.1 hypothetical protein [Coxiellaceae bacterium]
MLIIPVVCSSAQTLTPQENAANQAEFLRQQEREQLLREQQEQTPDVMSLQPSALIKDIGRLPIQESPCFKIKQIILVGDNAKRFQWALSAANRTEDGKKDPAINRCLGTKGINLVMRRIQNAIIKRGYITTRILAKPQDLSQGTLKLTVIPGLIHDIRFLTKAQAYYGTIWNAVPASQGDLLNLRDIEQALENFKRLPTVEADIQIVPAVAKDNKSKVKPGESDLVISRKPKFPLRLSLSADDSGARATGKYLGNVTLSCDGWALLNDLFYYNYNHDIGDGNPASSGTGGHTVHYSVPYGYWLLGFTHSSNRYHQTVVGFPQNYIYSGESQNDELRLSKIIYRDAVRKIKLWLSGWRRNYRNFNDDVEIINQHKLMAGWELGINHREFIRSSTLDLSLHYKQGTGAMGALRAPGEENGEGTSRPQIIIANVQFNLPFAVGKQQVRYTGEWRAQWNQTPLVPQDRFGIGGRYTVRGFDGEVLLSADRGWLIRNDLSFALRNTRQELYVGIDHGQVGGQSSESLIGTRLTGGVIGLRGSFLWFTYDVFASAPLAKPSGFKTSSKLAGFNLNFSV